MRLHTILGAKGTITTQLLPVLQQHGEKIRLVSRNPTPVAGAETRAADFLNAEQTRLAVDGSTIVYLLVGLEYSANVWRRDWPVIMRNVIAACKAASAQLIFLDSLYTYGRVAGAITENTPPRPVSEKGRILVEIEQLLLAEMNSGRLSAIIAKASDFYGPGAVEKSWSGSLVFSRLKNKQTPQWPVNARVPRTYTYTPDIGRALYVLAQHPEAFNQTWILPVASPTLTGQEFSALAAKYMQGSGKVQVLPKWVFGLMGLFIPFMKEAHEMMYQDENGYVLDSTRFNQTFNFTPTPYEEGIRATAEWFLKN
ncbi:NAD-dependent epimerase/dehydratase family protein [Hymenobacter bucti]|uniref:NAD-dependent epimerase/dehydratase family protein n=1 Tax=Hymenobacter bucti TaxID=1844114 RepID=A0ABW4R1A9_9BACT